MHRQASKLNGEAKVVGRLLHYVAKNQRDWNIYVQPLTYVWNTQLHCTTYSMPFVLFYFSSSMALQKLIIWPLYSLMRQRLHPCSCWSKTPIMNDKCVKRWKTANIMEATTILGKTISESLQCTLVVYRHTVCIHKWTATKNFSRRVTSDWIV